MTIQELAEQLLHIWGKTTLLKITCRTAYGLHELACGSDRDCVLFDNSARCVMAIWLLDEPEQIDATLSIASTVYAYRKDGIDHINKVPELDEKHNYIGWTQNT